MKSACVGVLSIIELVFRYFSKICQENSSFIKIGLE